MKIKRRYLNKHLFTIYFNNTIHNGRRILFIYKLLSNLMKQIMKQSFIVKVIGKGSLTHLSLVSLLWDIGKQHSPRCDAAERGVPSGAILFV